MTTDTNQSGTTTRDSWAYQRHILPHVSRTFALTIPQLPAPLDSAVTNAYLLCRIADTIEDDARLSASDKTQLHTEFLAALENGTDSAGFAAHAAEALAPETPERERELLRETPRILEVTHNLGQEHQRVLTRCVRIMCTGMGYYQRNAGLGGMSSVGETDRYCYYVAGVVGEMLTELFCLHSRDIREHRAELLELAPSFGEGLQLTNILKDFWDDRGRGACWLPRDVFARHGVALENLGAGPAHDPGFADGLRDMVAITHDHLQNAFSYTLTIPPHHRGIRRFCLWALGLAVLTLRRIERRPGYSCGEQVKVSRRTVRVTIAASNLTARHDPLLRMLFRGVTAGLPRQSTEMNASDVSCWLEAPALEPTTRRTAAANTAQRAALEGRSGRTAVTHAGNEG